jgi:hypothetical protein
MKSRFSQAMSAMSDSAHSSLDRLWATSEEERTRARAALRGLMGSIQVRQADEQLKFRMEQELSQHNLLAELQAVDKAEIDVIDEELEVRMCVCVSVYVCVFASLTDSAVRRPVLK